MKRFFLIPIMLFCAFAEIPITTTGLQAASTDRYVIGGYANSDTTFALTSGGTRGASQPAESTDVFCDANGNNAFSIPANISWRSWTIASGYTQNLTLSGRTTHFKYGVSTDGTGTFNWGSTIYLDSAGFIWHIGSGCGTQAFSAYTIYIGGSGTIDIDKASTIVGSLNIATGASVNLSGAVAPTFYVSTSAPPLTIAGTGSLTNTSGMVLQRATAGKFFNINSSATLDGSGTIFFSCGQGADTVPALTLTAASSILIFDRGSSSGSVIHTGHMGAPNVVQYLYRFSAAGVKNPIYLNGYNLTTKKFVIGTTNATDTVEVHLSSGTVTITEFDAASSVTGKNVIYFDTVTLACSGDFAVGGSAVTVYPGNSSITVSGSTGSLIAHNDKVFKNFSINKASSAVCSLATGSNFLAHKLTLSTGKFKQKKDIITVDSLIVSATDSSAFDTAVICSVAIFNSGSLPVWKTGSSLCAYRVVNGSGVTLPSNSCLISDSITIDSIVPHIKRDPVLRAARRLDTVTIHLTTNISDSSAYSRVYLGRDSTGAMTITRWFNTAGLDSIWAVVPANAALNVNYRPLVVSGAGVYSLVRTPVTWREKWVLNVKGQVR